jgi:hypothetical protein
VHGAHRRGRRGTERLVPKKFGVGILNLLGGRALPRRSRCPTCSFVAGGVHSELCSSELLPVPDSIIVRSERTVREAHRRYDVVRVPGPRHRKKSFSSPLKALLPRRKALVAGGVRGLPARSSSPLPRPLALGASGERERAPGRSSGRRSGGCSGASAGRPPPRAARTPICCVRVPSLPTSLHEPAPTRRRLSAELAPNQEVGRPSTPGRTATAGCLRGAMRRSGSSPPSVAVRVEPAVLIRCPPAFAPMSIFWHQQSDFYTAEAFSCRTKPPSVVSGIPIS